MEIRLLRDKLAVIPVSDPSKTPGGLYVPEEAKQRDDQGVVIYRGPDVQHVKVGDHIVFGGYVGSKVTLADHGVYLLMEESDVMAILSHHEDDPPPLLSYAQLERVVTSIQGDLALKGLPSQIVDQVCSEILSRVQSLTYSEGLEF